MHGVMYKMFAVKMEEYLELKVERKVQEHISGSFTLLFSVHSFSDRI